MKKILMIVCISIFLCGCSIFSSDTMVCTYHEQSNNTLVYNVKYNGESIKSIEIVKTIDFSTFSDADFDEQVKTINKEAKENNKVKGISEEVLVDKKIVTNTISVNIDKYDITKDSKFLFKVYFKKTEIDGIYSIREKLSDSGFECDEVTEK